MKILLIIPSLGRGGAERVAAALSLAWDPGHEVVLALLDGQRKVFPHGGRLVDIDCPAAASWPRKLLVLWRRIRRLATLIGKEEPDVVISFMESANFPAIAASLITKRLRRLTVSVRNNPAAFPMVYRALMPVLYRLPARVVAVSSGVKDALIQDFHLPASNCVSIPNPANIEAIQKASKTGFEEIPEPYVLGCGRLVKQKGFDYLIRAFEASGCYRNFLLVLVGDGRERGNLETLAQEIGLAGRVRFLGAVENPYPYLAHAECLVLSSRFEGWPNVLLEALVCSCPVVSFDCPYGPSEIIEHGKNGLLAKPGDVEDLAGKIRLLLENNNLHVELQKEGFRSIQDFRLEKVASRWLEVIP